METLLNNSLENRLESIKNSIRSSLKEEDSIKIASFTPLNKHSDRPTSPIIYSDELNYLNSNWGNWSEPSHFCSHRKILGRIIPFFKRKVQSFLFGSIFKDYLENEKVFMSNVVRFCNLSSRYIDERDKSIFWDLIKKLDNEIQHSELRDDAIMLRMFDESRQLIKDLENKLESQNKKILSLEHALEKMTNRSGENK
jgi:predicted ribosome quality control (RQC) complex YloA/Tae2 family protein